MARVAKWLRQRFVVPPFAGSIPVFRPYKSKKASSIEFRACFLAVSARRVLVELASHAPFATAIRQLRHRLQVMAVEPLY
jgi:hypothetical protein